MGGYTISPYNLVLELPNPYPPILFRDGKVAWSAIKNMAHINIGGLNPCSVVIRITAHGGLNPCSIVIGIMAHGYLINYWDYDSHWTSRGY